MTRPKEERKPAGCDMKVMVVGSGAREHTLALGISRSPQVKSVICVPGNAGTATFSQTLEINSENVEAVVEQAVLQNIDLVVIGPEAPLVAGMVDALEKKGIRAFGPYERGARLEGSKVFAKQFMAEYGIPTADFEVFEDPDRADDYVRRCPWPLVIKADGLAAGKGVIVTSNKEEALIGVDRIMRKREFGKAGDRIVVEKCLVGQEVSYHIICDGDRFVPLLASQDHKQIFDGDKGPNTGGMGAYSPPPVVTSKVEASILERVVIPTIKGFQDRGIVYRGALFIGLMIIDEYPYVLEYNARFGDPEAQVIIPRWKGDLVGLLLGSALGDIRNVETAWKTPASMCVVVASEGYPGSYPRGREIHGLDEAVSLDNIEIYHAGTKLVDSKVVTSGGRVLSVVAQGEDIDRVAEMAYRAVSKLTFEGMQYRRDIGWRARSDFR